MDAETNTDIGLGSAAEETVAGDGQATTATAPQARVIHAEPTEEAVEPRAEQAAPGYQARGPRANGGAPTREAGADGAATSEISMKSLLEAGVHFGHQTKRWNPKMRSYIFTERNGIHIIDLQQTVTGLRAAMGFVSDLVANGGKIIFVGTKKQAQEAVREEAQRGGQLYVTRRWLGGMLTNFTTIRNRLRYLADLEDRQARGDFANLPKAEARKLEEEIERLNSLLGGIKEMRDLPGAIYIVDPHRERIAVAEAMKLGIPIVAMVDTNCDPDEVDYVIPANDDAIRAVRVITAKMADAALEGQQRRETMRADMEMDYTIEPGEYSFAPDDEEV